MKAQKFYSLIIKYLLNKAVGDCSFNSQRDMILLQDDISNLYHIVELADSPQDMKTANELSKMERSGEFGALKRTLKQLLNNFND